MFVLATKKGTHVHSADLKSLFPHSKKTTSKQKKHKTLSVFSQNFQNLWQSYLKSPAVRCCLSLQSMEEDSQVFNYYVLIQHLLPVIPRRRAVGQENHLVAHIQQQLDCLR